MANLMNYDADRISVSWIIPGFALDLTQGLIDGAGAIVETKDGPRWTRSSDRQGNTTRNRNRKRGGTLTFTYAASAEIHDILAGIMQIDDQLETMVGTIAIKDLNGTTLLTYSGAFIEDDPTINYGDTAADRAYVFGFAERIAFLGGAAVL